MSEIKNKLKIMKNRKQINTAVSELKAQWKAYLERQKSGVKHSLDVDSYNEWEKKYAEYKSFSQVFLDIVAEKDLSSIEVYTKAHIDRRLYSKMKTDYCYRPNKNTAIKLCFALDLSFEEAEVLLKKAGFALMKWDPFDLAIAYCFQHGITDIDIVNEILTELDLDTI